MSELLSKNVREKYTVIQNQIKAYQKLLVAYSGGVDSVLLLKIATDVLGENAKGIIADSPSLARSEYKEAIEIAEQFNFNIACIETKEFDKEEYLTNPDNRCYFCKKELFSEMLDYAAANGYKNIADGSNADDMGDYRPGKMAAKELNVISPLRDSGFTKNEIRELSKYLDLPTWNKPALACLASRIPSGSRISVKKISQVEQAEAFLYSLGFKELRVRHHDNVARIELNPLEIPKMLNEDVREKVNDALKKIGFTFVALDLKGYAQGRLNEIIANAVTKQ